MNDPFKELTRQYDRRICARGGRSIFGPFGGLPEKLLGKKPGPPALEKSAPMAPDEIKALADRKHRRFTKLHQAASEAARGRGPKPGRLTAGLMGKLGGFMDDLP